MALLALWNPNIQFLKTDGTINAGGKLVVTDHNDAESIPANYSDADGTTLNPSPIVLDALGRATCYIDDASTYDLYVKDANGATLWTVSEMTPGAETIVVRAGFSVSSTDSSVTVVISVDPNGVTNYDLSIQKEIDRAEGAEGDLAEDIADEAERATAAEKAAKTEVVAGNNIDVTKTTGANGQDVYTITGKAAKTEVVAGNNITVTKTVGADGQDVYTIDGEDGGVEGVYGVYTRVGNAWSKYSGDADITSLAEGNYHYTLFIGYSVSTPSNVIAEIESNAGTQTHRAQVDCSYAHDGWVEFSGDFYGTVLNPTLVFPTGVSLYPAAYLFVHSTAGGGSGGGSGDNDKVAVDAGAVAGYLKDVLVSASDMVSLVPSGNKLMVNVNSRLVVFSATFTPSSGTYQWPDAAEVASAVASGKGVAIDLATQGNVVRYYLHYTNGSSVYIFESTSFSRITLTSGAYALVSMIDTELKSDSANPVTNSALTAIIGNVEAALASL